MPGVLVDTTNITARPVRELCLISSVAVSSTLSGKIFLFCSQSIQRVRLDDGGWKLRSDSTHSETQSRHFLFKELCPQRWPWDDGSKAQATRGVLWCKAHKLRKVLGRTRSTVATVGTLRFRPALNVLQLVHVPPSYSTVGGWQYRKCAHCFLTRELHLEPSVADAIGVFKLCEAQGR